MIYPLARRIVKGPAYTPALWSDIRVSIERAKRKHKKPEVVFVGRYSLGKVTPQ